MMSTEDEIDSFIAFLARQPHKHKVVIAGEWVGESEKTNEDRECRSDFAILAFVLYSLLFAGNHDTMFDTEAGAACHVTNIKKKQQQQQRQRKQQQTCKITEQMFCFSKISFMSANGASYRAPFVSIPFP